jgi:hypothetical protein
LKIFEAEQSRRRRRKKNREEQSRAVDIDELLVANSDFLILGCCLIIFSTVNSIVFALISSEALCRDEREKCMSSGGVARSMATLIPFRAQRDGRRGGCSLSGVLPLVCERHKENPESERRRVEKGR